MTDPDGLGRLELFAGLDAGAVGGAVAGLRAVEVPAGEEFHVGPTGAICCIVDSGRLALFFVAAEGRERTIGILEEGDLLVRPTEGWASVGPQVRCFAIED